MAQTEAIVNDKREIFGWAMYDWANSAFSTTIGTVFLGPYVASLAATAGKAYPDGLARLGGLAIAPDSFFPSCVSLSVLGQVIFLPILGAVADYSHVRKPMMQVFATFGALMTILMFLVTGSLWWLGGLLFILANLAFGGAVVLYNSYLPDIASEDQRDRVSSYGWAMGYLGDGILLALNLALYHLSRQARHPHRACHSRQPGFGRDLVADLLILHLGAPAAAACPAASADRRDLYEHRLQATGEDDPRDPALPRNAQVPGGILPL